MNHAYETYQLGDLNTEDLKAIDSAALTGDFEKFKDTVLEVTRRRITNEHWDDVIFVLHELVMENGDIIREGEEFQPWELI